MMPDIITQTTTIFDYPNAPRASILDLQTVSTQPIASDLSTATGLLAPSVAVGDRLAHFPEELYDLTPGSHLVRFLKAMLGDSGVGQLRKRQLVARLQAMLNSTHFYDLDRFYGALFGAKRGMLGALPVNPYTDTATADGWDEISDFDARFRERLIRLAQAITLGGTPQGVQAIAEALTGVECDVIEVWALIEWQGSSQSGVTWNEAEGDFPTWADTQGLTWNDVEGSITFGNLGIDAPNEVVVRPKRTYENTPEGARQRAEDTRSILRVVDVLKPAHSLVTVDTSGVQVRRPVAIAAVSADSEYWEISSRVIPRNELKPFYSIALRTYDHRANPQGINSAKPQPAFSDSSGQQWSYAGDMVSATADTRDTNKNYDTVTFSGKKRTYLPSYAVIDPRTASAARVASEGAIVAAPYSGPRKTVPTHG